MAQKRLSDDMSICELYPSVYPCIIGQGMCSSVLEKEIFLEHNIFCSIDLSFRVSVLGRKSRLLVTDAPM